MREKEEQLVNPAASFLLVYVANPILHKTHFSGSWRNMGVDAPQMTCGVLLVTSPPVVKKGSSSNSSFSMVSSLRTSSVLIRPSRSRSLRAPVRHICAYPSALCVLVRRIIPNGLTLWSSRSKCQTQHQSSSSTTWLKNPTSSPSVVVMSTACTVSAWVCRATAPRLLLTISSCGATRELSRFKGICQVSVALLGLYCHQ